MKNILSLLVLCFISHLAKAQTPEQFDTLGRLIYKEFTDTSTQNQSEFIRISNYKALIDKQDMPTSQKERLKYRIEEKYDYEYAQYWQAYKELKDSYDYEVSDGATFEYIDTQFEEMEGTKYAYHLKTRFMYRNGKVQTMVALVYDAAWFFEFFQIMSPIKEDF